MCFLCYCCFALKVNDFLSSTWASLPRSIVLPICVVHDTAPSSTEHQSAHHAALRLDVNEQVEFEVSFCSEEPTSITAEMTLQVEDNQYGKTRIQVTGEAYQEVVSLDNIGQEIDQEDEEGGKRRQRGAEKC